MGVIAHQPVCPSFSHSDLFLLFFQIKVLINPDFRPQLEILIFYIVFVVKYSYDY